MIVTAATGKGDREQLRKMIGQPENRWTKEKILNLLKNPKTKDKGAIKEASEVAGKLKTTAFVSYDRIILRHTTTNEDGTTTTKDQEFSWSSELSASGVVYGFYDPATNTVYMFSAWTPLAALEITHHEGITHVKTTDEYTARAESAMFMERQGFGTHFPNYLEAAKSGGKQPNQQAINSAISQSAAYQPNTRTTVVGMWQGKGKNEKRIR
jgi:hypothetical protein